MKSDIDRWNSKYRSHRFTKDILPDPILAEHDSLLTGQGCVLDVASGECDNALYLAACGYAAFAIDGSYEGLKSGRKKAAANGLGLNCFVADLDSYPIPPGLFDVVVVVRYLNRNMIDSVRRSLKQNGLLFFKTFNHRFLDQNPTFPEKYVLRRGELSNWFSDWVCINSNEGSQGDEIQYYWVGRKS